MKNTNFTFYQRKSSKVDYFHRKKLLLFLLFTLSSFLSINLNDLHAQCDDKVLDAMTDGCAPVGATTANIAMTGLLTSCISYDINPDGSFVSENMLTIAAGGVTGSTTFAGPGTGNFIIGVNVMGATLDFEDDCGDGFSCDSGDNWFHASDPGGNLLTYLVSDHDIGGDPAGLGGGAAGADWDSGSCACGGPFGNEIVAIPDYMGTINFISSIDGNLGFTSHDLTNGDTDHSAALTVGTHTITLDLSGHTYPALDGVSNAMMVTVDATPDPQMTCPSGPVSTGDGLINLGFTDNNAAAAINGAAVETISGDGAAFVTAGSFDPAAAGEGIWTVTFELESVNGLCTESVSCLIEVVTACEAEAGSLSITAGAEICPGEGSFSIMVQGENILYPDGVTNPDPPFNSSDGDPTNGVYFLDFYAGVGPVPSNPYFTGTFGDINFQVLATEPGVGGNPQLDFSYDDATNVWSDAGGNVYPMDVLICVVGSVWSEIGVVDDDTDPGQPNTGPVAGCGDATDYVCFTLISEIAYDGAESYACLGAFENDADEVLTLTLGAISGGSGTYNACGGTGLYQGFNLAGGGNPPNYDGTTAITSGFQFNVYANQPWSLDICDENGCELTISGGYNFPTSDILMSSFACSTGAASDIDVTTVGTTLNANLDGGVLSGPGVTDNGVGADPRGTFDPAVAGVGVHEITFVITDDITGCEKTSTQIVNVQPCAPSCSSVILDLSLQEDDVCTGQTIDLTLPITPDLLALVDAVANGGDGDGMVGEEGTTEGDNLLALFEFGINATPNTFSNSPYTAPPTVLGTPTDVFGVSGNSSISGFATFTHTGTTCAPEEYVVYAYLADAAFEANGGFIPDDCAPWVAEVITVYPDPADFGTRTVALGNCQLEVIPTFAGEDCPNYTVIPSIIPATQTGGGTIAVQIHAPDDAVAGASCAAFTVDVDVDDVLAYDAAETYACSADADGNIIFISDDQVLDMTLGAIAGGSGTYTVCGGSGVYSDVSGTALVFDGSVSIASSDVINVHANQPWNLSICDENGCELEIAGLYSFPEGEIDVAGFACTTGNVMPIFYGAEDGNNLNASNFPNLTTVSLTEFGSATGALTDNGDGTASWDPAISGEGDFEILLEIVDGTTGCARSTFEEIRVETCSPACSSVILDLSLQQDDVCTGSTIDLSLPITPDMVALVEAAVSTGTDVNGEIDTAAEEAALIALFEFGVNADANDFADNPYTTGSLGGHITSLGTADDFFGPLDNPSVFLNATFTHSGADNCTPENYIVYAFLNTAQAATLGVEPSCQPWVAEAITVWPDPADQTVMISSTDGCTTTFTSSCPNMIVSPSSYVANDGDAATTVAVTLSIPGNECAASTTDVAVGACDIDCDVYDIHDLVAEETSLCTGETTDLTASVSDDLNGVNIYFGYYIGNIDNPYDAIGLGIVNDLGSDIADEIFGIGGANYAQLSTAGLPANTTCAPIEYTVIAYLDRVTPDATTPQGVIDNNCAPIAFTTVTVWPDPANATVMIASTDGCTTTFTSSCPNMIVSPSSYVANDGDAATTVAVTLSIPGNECAASTTDVAVGACDIDCDVYDIHDLVAEETSLCTGETTNLTASVSDDLNGVNIYFGYYIGNIDNPYDAIGLGIVNDLGSDIADEIFGIGGANYAQLSTAGLPANTTCAPIEYTVIAYLDRVTPDATTPQGVIDNNCAPIAFTTVTVWPDPANASITVTPTTIGCTTTFVSSCPNMIVSPSSYTPAAGATNTTVNVTLSVPGNECASATKVVTVPTGGPSSASFTVTNTTCPGASNDADDGELTVIPAGGVGPYTYLWSTGETTVTISDLTAGGYTVTVADANGCSNVFASEVVESPDVGAPTVASCPTNVAQNVDAGVCGANVTYTTPVFMDNCDGATLDGTLVAGLASGNIFPVGTTTVTWTYQDVADNTAASCSFTVIITDNEVPIANCVPAFNLSLDADGNANITVADINNNSTDNCAIASMAIDNTAFTCANLGANTITLTVTDAAGLTSTCTTEVTIENEEQASIATCPADIVVNNDAGLCTAVVTYATPTFNDGCNSTYNGTLTTAATTASGSAFALGTTLVSHQYSDSDGYTVTCNFNVTVNDNEAPTFTCPVGPVDVQGCDGLVPDLLTGIADEMDNCSATVGMSQSPAAGVSIGGFGNSVMVTILATDGNGNNTTCSVTVNVIDDTNPIFQNCPTSMVVGNDVDECWAKVEFPAPVAFDNCTIMDETDIAATGLLADDIYPVGSTTISYVATDIDGNTATCTFDIMVMDTQDPELDLDVNMPADATSECDDVMPAFVLTNNDVQDNCTAPTDITIDFTEVSTQDANTAACGHYNYTLTRTWVITDQAGNTTTHTQLLTVEDTTAPMAMCQDITVLLDDFGMATIVPADIDTGSTDNCAAAADLTFGLSVSTFDCESVGENEIMLFVTDPCGNVDTCLSVVTVEETVPCNPEYDFDGSDPCACLNNATTLEDGQFSEFIQIEATAGNTWTLASGAGLYNVASPAPPAAPIPVNYGTDVMTNGAVDGFDNDMDGAIDEADENIYYTFSAIHVDEEGYSATFTNANFPGIQFNFTNTCFYPTPVFTNIPTELCVGSSFEIAVEDMFGAVADNITILVDGVPTNTFDGAGLGLGTHTITATFDAGAAANFSAINGVVNTDPDPLVDPNFVATLGEAQADPGCMATISTTVNIIETPTQIACNDLVQVSLDAIDCITEITPDMVLEGGYECFDDYSVEITYPFGTTGYTPPNQVDGSHAEMTFVYSLVHPTSGNVCWGEIYVEDKAAPVITCPADITISCTANIDNLTLTGAPTVTDCSNFTVDFVDDIFFNDECGDPIMVITRTFIANDIYGNESSCGEQIITVERPDLNDVEFPEGIVFTCDQYNAFPNITDPTNLLLGGLPTHPTFTDLQNASNVALTNSQLPNTGSGYPSIDGLTIGETGVCMLTVSVDDDIYDGCGNTFEILRTWKVRDMCLPLGPNNPVEFVQIIKVRDVAAPMIDVPAEITVNANVNGEHPVACTASFTLPVANITDNCSEIINIETNHPDGTNETNGGTISGLVIGDYTITYVATDACGNVGFADVIVHVVDDVAPTPICDEITDVALSSDGIAVVDAITFDDGSYDNCCLENITAARMLGANAPADSQFGATVSFTCADIATNNNMVVMRVEDCYGNTNDCMVEVIVEDKLPPYKVADVADFNIDCDVYYNNLEVVLDLAIADGNDDPAILNTLYGRPVYADNCDTIVDHTFAVNINSCGEGTITRTWTVEDGATPANVGPTCQQLIIVSHVNNWEVAFPTDVTLECTEGMNPGEDEDLFGEPTVFFDDCELIAVAQEDQIFNVVPDACYKIIRTFTAINWCVYDGADEDVNNAATTAATTAADNTFVSARRFRDGTNGIIIYQQVIKVLDEVAPVITCPTLDDVPVNANCVATVNLPFLLDTMDCSPNVVVTVTTPGLGQNGSTGIGYGPFSNVAIGTYTTTYTATDNCGNSESCEMTFSVVDNKPPTPYCVGGLVVELMPVDANGDGVIEEGMVDIWASDFDAGSFDNCPGAVKLTVWLNADNYASSQTLGYEDALNLNGSLPISCNSPFDWNFGSNDVYMYVTDASGNVDFCITTLIIESNPDIPACPTPDSDAIVAGTIETEAGVMVSDVMVDMSGAMAANMMTSTDGAYSFEVNEGGDYTVAPMRDDNPLNGVTTYDLVLIKQHILTTNPLNSAYKQIAADANNSGSITTYDIVQLRQLILFVIDELPSSNSWRFVDADHVFNNTTDWTDGFPEVLNYNNLATAELNANFIGIKVGDVNGSSIANIDGNNLEERSGDNFLLETQDRYFQAGETVNVSMNAATADALLGMQFTLNFDAAMLQFNQVNAGELNAEHFGLAKLNEGAITASWNTEANTGKAFRANEALFTLEFTAKTAGQLSDALTLNSRYTAAEAYTTNGTETDWSNLALSFGNNEIANAFELYQNEPNPVKDITKIAFDLPSASAATLTVRDITGKVITRVEGDYAKGMNAITLSNLNATGVLTYTLETATFTATKSMVVLK